MLRRRSKFDIKKLLNIVVKNEFIIGGLDKMWDLLMDLGFYLEYL